MPTGCNKTYLKTLLSSVDIAVVNIGVNRSKLSCKHRSAFVQVDAADAKRAIETLDGHAFASRLLEQAGVAVMPGTSFGAVTRDWIRLSLTVPDEVLQRACDRIAALCA